MTAEQYEHWAGLIRRSPAAVCTLTAVNRFLPLLYYCSFPLLLLIAGLKHAPWAYFLAFSGISFGLVSIFRKMINRKRPYEALDIRPIVAKDTSGCSFPSRHVYSAFYIAAFSFYFSPLLGAILLLCSCVIAAARVLGGVHYPSDVLAGAGLGALSGYLCWALL